MVTQALFTRSDLVTIERAAVVAERLTGRYFGLSEGEWQRNPYGIFTRKEVDESLYFDDVFAHLVQMERRRSKGYDRSDHIIFGIVLQDPQILLALLRGESLDLWTLALFILTHELTHIVRFRRRESDIHATGAEREREERTVHEITSDILSGVAGAESLVRLYGPALSDMQLSSQSV